MLKDSKGLAQGHTRQDQNRQKGLHTHSLSPAPGYISASVTCNKKQKTMKFGTPVWSPCELQRGGPARESWGWGERKETTKGKERLSSNPCGPFATLHLDTRKGHWSQLLILPSPYHLPSFHLIKSHRFHSHVFSYILLCKYSLQKLILNPRAAGTYNNACSS